MTEPIPFKDVKTGAKVERPCLLGGHSSPTFTKLPVPDPNARIGLGDAETVKHGAPRQRREQFVTWLYTTNEPTVHGACTEGGLEMADVQFGIARGQLRVSS